MRPAQLRGITATYPLGYIHRFCAGFFQVRYGPLNPNPKDPSNEASFIEGDSWAAPAAAEGALLLGGVASRCRRR